jgi:hypothetical protein
MVKKVFPCEVKNKIRIVTPLLALCLLLTVTTITSTTILPFQVVKAQNATVKLETDQVSSNVISNLAKPGFGNKYDLTAKGNTLPINYNILGGSLVGILADTSRHSLDLAFNPGSDGGAVEVELPRNVVDSKSNTGTDMPFIVKIDGQRISGEPTGICIGTCPNIFNSFKETGNTNTDRVLTIIFGPESRFIEVIGNKGI